jgi:hypothetical protein
VTALAGIVGACKPGEVLPRQAKRLLTLNAGDK